VSGLSEPTTRRELGDGLVARWATPADTERIIAFNGLVFRNAAEDPPSRGVMAQTRDWLSGRHPLVGVEDFAIVEDTARGALVASTCLTRQTWQYDGVRFDVGRPELVATDPDYRNRGLVRAIFDLIHARSAALGQVAQAITGIPYFYRQFGYEYALDLDAGRRAYLATIPDAEEGKPEPYRLRPATEADLPFIMALYDRRRAPYLLSTAVPEDFWRSTFGAPRDDYNMQWCLQVIVDAAGPADAPRGYVQHGSKRWGPELVVWDVAVEDGLSLHAVALPVLRTLRDLGAATPPGQSDRPYSGLALMLGREHPFYAAIGEEVAPGVHSPYAWYVRIPDLPGFLRLIAPVLERRLATSAFAGHTGELRLDFYRGGLRLTLRDGGLAGIEPWRRPAWGERQNAGFPPLVFLQLLLGWRSLAELDATYPDVLASDAEARALLDTLFPKRPSWVIWAE
jgi:hypothetical protein